MSGYARCRRGHAAFALTEARMVLAVFHSLYFHREGAGLSQRSAGNGIDHHNIQHENAPTTLLTFDTHIAELCVEGRLRYRLYDGRPSDLKLTHNASPLDQPVRLFPDPLCECAMAKIEADGATELKIVTMDSRQAYAVVRTARGFNVIMRLWAVDHVRDSLRRMQQELTWRIGRAARNDAAAEAIQAALRDSLWPVGPRLARNRACAVFNAGSNHG